MSPSKTGGTSCHVLSHSFVEERLFLIAFSCYVFAAWFTATGYQTFFGLDYNWFKRLIYGVSLVCLAGKYLLQGNTINEHLIVASIGIIFLISAITSSNHLLIWCFIFVVSSRHISIKSLSFCFFMILILIGLITFSGYFLGAVPSHDLPSTMTRDVRYSLGFSHPNTLGFFLLSIQLAWISMRGISVDTKDLVFATIFAVFSRCLTDSRTVDGAFMLLIITIIVLLIKQNRSSSRGQSTGSVASPLIIALYTIIAASVVFSIFSMVFYDGANSVWTKLDTLFSGRLHLANQYYYETGISAFGHSFKDSAVQAFDIHGEGVTFLVDNLYCNILLYYGWIPWLVSFGGIAVSLRRLRKRQQYTCYLGIILFLLIGLFEAMLFNLRVDFFILGLRAALYRTDFCDQNPTDSVLSSLPLYLRLCGLTAQKESPHWNRK